MDDMTSLTHKADGTARHPATSAVLRHFRFEHLPPHLQEVSRACGELAVGMADSLPEGPDLTYGLRDLLAAKDNFVRARLPAAACPANSLNPGGANDPPPRDPEPIGG